MTRDEKIAILIAWLDGKIVQFMSNSRPGEWMDYRLGSPPNVKASHLKWRIKPETLNINGHDVPAPERTAPSAGTTYWIPSLETKYGELKYTWDGDEFDIDYRWLQRGLVHLTPENAQLHSKALLSFTKQNS